MIKRPFRWTRKARNLRILIEANGVQHTKDWITEVRRKAAERQGWQPSEAAMTIASDHILIDEVARCIKH